MKILIVGNNLFLPVDTSDFNNITQRYINTSLDGVVLHTLAVTKAEILTTFETTPIEICKYDFDEKMEELKKQKQ